MLAIARSLRNTAKAADGLEGSIGRVANTAEDAGRAVGSISPTSCIVAHAVLQRRKAAKALIRRLQVA